jgi:hypothetical protein
MERLYQLRLEYAQNLKDLTFPLDFADMAKLTERGKAICDEALALTQALNVVWSI